MRGGHRVLDPTVPLDLLLLGLGELAHRQEVPVHHRLAVAVIVAEHRLGQLRDHGLELRPILDLIEVEGRRVAVLLTALILPVLGAGTLAVPRMGTVVLFDLSGDDDVEFHTDILANSEPEYTTKRKE